MTSDPTKIKIPEVIDRFKAYHDTHPSWGVLHVILADGNIGSPTVARCVKDAVEQGDLEGWILGRILLKMTKSQRSRLGRMIR